MCGPCPGGVCVAFIRCLLQAHRGLVSTSLHTNLASDALKMAIWQRKRQDADFTSKVHSLPTAESSAEPFATGRPWPTARRWPRRAPSAGSYDNALVGQLLVQGRAHPQQGHLDRNRRGRDRHRPVDLLVQHSLPPHTTTARSPCTPPIERETAWTPLPPSPDNTQSQPDKPPSTKPGLDSCSRPWR